jgi:uncharacterized protein
MGQEEMMRVVLDTNVVVSGLLFGGEPGRIVDMWEKRTITPYMSKEILDEYIRVLTYPKFRLNESEIEYLIYNMLLPNFEVVVLPAVRPVIIDPDPSDDLFIYCARAANVEYLISAEDHLVRLKFIDQIPVVTVVEFLKRLT